jgi:hypothetical protein
VVRIHDRPSPVRLRTGTWKGSGETGSFPRLPGAAPIKGMRNGVELPMIKPTAAMKIGDLVLYQGRSYYLRGLDPMGVPERRVILEDPETGEEVAALATEVSSAEPPAEPSPPTAV